jgi:hypothetical protein
VLAAVVCAVALLLPRAGAQTYTSETAPGVTAYSAWSNSPAASTYAPYIYAPPPTPVAGAGSPTGCSGVGGTCVPVTVVGSATTGFYLQRNGAPYWFRRVRHACACACFCAACSHAAPSHPRVSRAARACPVRA